MTAQLAFAALRTAVVLRGLVDTVIVRSDRGSQLRCRAFRGCRPTAG